MHVQAENGERSGLHAVVAPMALRQCLQTYYLRVHVQAEDGVSSGLHVGCAPIDPGSCLQAELMRLRVLAEMANRGVDGLP